MSSLGNLNRFHDLSSDADIEFYAVDMDPDTLLGSDYEGVDNFLKIIQYVNKIIN